MARKARERRPRLTKAHIAQSREIVQDELGKHFSLETEGIPRNVGVKGDTRVVGATVIINSELANPIRFIAEEHQLMEGVSTRLTNLVYPITRVLFDITPPPKEDELPIPSTSPPANQIIPSTEYL